MNLGSSNYDITFYMPPSVVIQMHWHRKELSDELGSESVLKLTGRLVPAKGTVDD